MNNRQKLAIKNMVVKGGSMKDAMLNAGYSGAYARNPQKLLKSKSVQEDLEKFNISTSLKNLAQKKYINTIEFSALMTDEEITELLKSAGVKIFKIKKMLAKKMVYTVDVSPGVALKAIDLIAKIRGDFAPLKIEDESNKYLHGLSDEDLDKLLLDMYERSRNNSKNIQRKTKKAIRGKK